MFLLSIKGGQILKDTGIVGTENWKIQDKKDDNNNKSWQTFYFIL